MLPSNESNNANNPDGKKPKEINEKLRQYVMESMQENGIDPTQFPIHKIDPGRKNNKEQPQKENENPGKEHLEDVGEPLIKEAAPGEDLTQIDESLVPVEGLNFVAQKLPERKKPGLGTKIRNWLSYYTGKTIGKIGGFFATLGKGIADLFKKGPGTFGGIRNGMRGSSRFREKTNSNVIPGWNGATFEEVTGPDDQVNVDFRRVPDVWSLPIAENATEGDDKDKSAKPRDPVISVYVTQTSDKYTASNEGTGHSGIGIEYSRYSAKAGRWQRYKVRFGYAMKGGGGSVTAKLAVTGYNNATIPGMITNESNRAYDISRSYPAKPKQVSNVLRAAESYAEQGGYNAYTRNCTTFAKEMIVDVAKIKGAESVFAKENVTTDAKTDAKLFGAAAIAPIFKAEMENGFEKIRGKKDLDYQNFGNEMVTKDEYERYKNSLKLFSKRSSETYSPNAVGENLMRAEGGKAGQIGKNSVINLNKLSHFSNESHLSAMVRLLALSFYDLKNVIEGITPKDIEKPQEFENLIKELDFSDFKTKLNKLIPDYQNKNNENQFKQSDLVNGRTMMTDMIKNLNKLLFKYYQNDKRIQPLILHNIDILNNVISLIDHAYRTTQKKDLNVEDSDLGDLKSNFSDKFYYFKNDKKSYGITSTGYEAWLQIYKTPQAAMEKIMEYKNLEEKHKKGILSPREKRDFYSFCRIINLASDFVTSHNYMMDKEEYNQQDVDYAFSLAKKERPNDGTDFDLFEKQKDNDNTMSEMTDPNASAGRTYQMLIMKTVFGGMKGRFKELYNGNFDAKEAAAWLDNDAANCVKNHEKEMTMILLGLKHTIDEPDKEKLEAGFTNLLTRWLSQLFRTNTYKDGYKAIVTALQKADSTVMKETGKLITRVMSEEQKSKENTDN